MDSQQPAYSTGSETVVDSAAFARAESAAVALLAAGRRAEAYEAFARIAERWPDAERPATTAAVLALEVEGAIAAQPRLVQTTQRFPRSATAWTALGNGAASRGALDDAIDALERAAALAPDDAAAWYNLGRARLLAGDAANADAAFDRALALEPRHVPAMAGRAAAANWTSRWTDGERWGRAALAVAPNDADAATNLGVALLAQGRWDEGWTHYEARWRIAASAGARRDWPGRRWHGEDAAGATIVVHAEQGLGDTLQFVRFVPALRERGMRVVLAVQPELVRLLATQRFAYDVVSMHGPLPDAGWHAPLLSLPRYVPMPSGAPYLARPTAPPRADARPRIGLAWAGSATHANDRNRSVPFVALRPLLDVGGVSWQSLQHGRRAADAGADAIRPLPAVRDLADTAAVIAGLDIVVTVDTSVAHLAAAMGVPTWILLPSDGLDWRWAFAPAGRTPWYDAVRLVRQPVGSTWADVIRGLADALRRGLSGEVAA
jgi:Flp pilus assembly protein TadD